MKKQVIIKASEAVFAAFLSPFNLASYDSHRRIRLFGSKSHTKEVFEVLKACGVVHMVFGNKRWILKAVKFMAAKPRLTPEILHHATGLDA